MISLEKFSLDIRCYHDTNFMDGNHVKKMINHLTKLNQFTFHIQSMIYCELVLEHPSNEQIQDKIMNLKEY